MKRYIVNIIIFIIPCFCAAQIDSSYIRPFDHKLSIQPYIAKDMLFMNQKFETGEEITFMPNNPPKIGAGISLNNTIITFGYGYGFDFMRDKKYGKTKAFDFQLHSYQRKFVLDLFIQQYKGFYEDDMKNEVRLYPDMKIEQYGVYGQYIFNNRKFSYKAAFNQNEKQLKSAGSFLLGGGIYQTKIRSDSSFYYNEKNNLDNFQFGISAGYAYIWVLGRYWDISASATAGINVGSEKFSNFGRKIEVSPTIFPRISAGYNHKTWSLGFSYVGNMIFPAMSEKTSVGIHSGSFQLSFIKRFNLIPIIDKKTTL